MSLPNYLAKIKSSGIYRFVWDKSEIAGVDAEVLRLVVGYSEKGPFNTPVYIQSESEFKNIFGNISKKLEKRGIWFHRLAIQALSKGPIIALNLKKFNTETVKSTAFNTTETKIELNDIEVKKLYDTTRFWKLDPETMADAASEKSATPENKDFYISLSATDSKDSSVSVFIRGYKPTGYDVTLKNWYSTLGEEMPDYFIQEIDDNGTKKTIDYSSLLVSDFFAEIYVFKGEFTPAICATEPLNKYFDIVDGKVQLKEYIENAFGEKTDTLSALASDDSSNFLNSYSGCLLPYFKNQQNTYISLDLLVNADSNVHKLMMNLNADLLYDGTIKPTDIVTTGWLKNYSFGSVTKDTTEIYTCEDTPDYISDSTNIVLKHNYNQKYVANPETTVYDTDYIKYNGTDFCKYLGGYEYKIDHIETITINDKSVVAEVYTEAIKDESYSGYDTVYLVDGLTYYKDEETSEYKTFEITLQDLKTISVNFTENKISSETFGDATVKYDKYDDTYLILTVISSEGFAVGDELYVKSQSLVNGNSYDFYEKDGEKISDEKTDTITFTVVNSTDYFRYVEGDDKDKYIHYFSVAEKPVYADIYIDSDNNVYKKTEDAEEYTQIENAVPGEITSDTGNKTDFISLGIEAGDRVFTHNTTGEIEKDVKHFYTVVEVKSDWLKISNMYGDEKYISLKDTITKCNHSAGITCYKLLPYYFEGYKYTLEKPDSNTDYDKLQWQNKILSVITEEAGIRAALTSRVDIDYRYIVDTFEAYVSSEVHKELALIAKEKDNAVAFLNFPAAKTFKKCSYTSFTDENDNFKVKYIKEGGNKKKNPGVLFSLVSETNGASYVSYNTPLAFSDGTVTNYVPAAALVSNNFMDKYSGRQPYYVVAGPTYGRLIYNGLVGPDFNYSRADLDILEPMGVNVTVFVPRLGTYINSNQTAKQNPKTALSSLNVRELVIYLQDEIEKLLQGYQWEFNTPYLRDLIKAKADTICENVKNNGGIQEYLNVCDTSNNTNDVIDNEMFILSTSIEPGRGCGKMVQELTLYKTGGLSALIK